MPAGKGGTDGLLLLLAQLKNNDEDAKKRQKVRRLTPKQAVELRKLLRKQRDEYLFPTDRFYVRKARDGHFYVYRSRRIHSDNLLRKKKSDFDARGSII